MQLKRRAFTRTLRAFPAALMVAAASHAWAAVRINGFELVHTAPVETTLTTPDLRDPATVWCEMIDGARKTIDIEQYYVAGKAGSRLDRVIASLSAAGRRGVHIRFLMEQKGLSASDQPTIDRLRAIPNVEFRMLEFAKVSGSGIIHAKYFVVDGASAYLGSQNFDWRALEHIDEAGLRIDDATIAKQLEAIFEQDWQAQAQVAAGASVPSLPDAAPADDSSPAFLVASPRAFNPPGIRDSEQELVRLIGAAKHDIRIELMSYVPLKFSGGYYGVIDQALRTAAARGVKIKLAVADWSTGGTKTPYLKSLAVLPNIEVRIVSIPQAKAGFIPFSRVVHTKTMDIDDEVAWIGTSNWEGGYLDTSRNVEMVLRNPEMARRIGALHEQLWSSAYAAPIDIMREYQPPRRQAQ